MTHLDQMCSKAREILKNSYSPYSHFPVSCVLRTKNNHIFAGVNVENAAYPVGACAEASALSAMVTAGEREVVEVVICSAAKDFCFPCGGCRQRLAEFAHSDTIIHIIHASHGERFTTTMGELLPHSFTKLSMEK